MYMYIALGILAYLIVGELLFILLVKLEVAKIITIFEIEDNEILVSLLTCFFWPVFILVMILAAPAYWAKKRFNK